MTKEKFVELFPLLPPALVISYWIEATAGGRSINDKDLMRVGVHEWLSHLGFIGDIIIRDIVDVVYNTCEPEYPPSLTIIDHKIVAIDHVYMHGTGEGMSMVLVDILPGPNAGKIIASGLIKIASAMETNFTLYTSAMLKRLRSYYAEGKEENLPQV